ncbi:hypothetical protein OB236_10535 [Paenibacillus sp. WQ 127069]|uniref:Integrase n=1 Tax=Paenibacillus baimaensis TaxID=2982185 RepID=A0ABT2UD85_9BACL|nr:hypothetical protein [Paenibacillus sp. WQ 127069]MCU6792562.1 hypothetical protein [Paenibacillus sp. WQ 127069]
MDFIQGMLGHEKASTTQIYASYEVSGAENCIAGYSRSYE